MVRVKECCGWLFNHWRRDGTAVEVAAERKGEYATDARCKCSNRVFCTKRRLPTTALIYRMKSCANNCPSADDEKEEMEEEADDIWLAGLHIARWNRCRWRHWRQITGDDGLRKSPTEQAKIKRKIQDANVRVPRDIWFRWGPSAPEPLVDLQKWPAQE